MDPRSRACPTNDECEQLLFGDCSDEDRTWFEDHLEACADCQTRVSSLSATADWQRLMPIDQTLRLDDIPTLRSEGYSDSDLNIPGYVIEEVMGRGGMATVYRAVQSSVNRPVALKVLRSTATENPSRWLRFKTEVEAIGRLQHPHIVRIFDAGEHEGRAYVSQELCDSDSLDARVQTRQKPRAIAVMMQQLADAVEHAHQQGVLHRDIKPSNILFVGDTIKLADFGLAKLTDSDDALTRTRDVMGSPAYMAPEQTAADHDAIGPHTDVFQLGIVMYELLTGVRPFTAENTLEILHLIQTHEPVSIKQLRPGIPIDLNTICMKCLEKEPSRRYPTSVALSEDLKRFSDDRPILAKPPGFSSRILKLARRHPAVTVLVLMFALLIAGWAQFTRQLQVQTQIANERTLAAEEALGAQTSARNAAQEVLSFMTTDLFETVRFVDAGSDNKVTAMLTAATKEIDEGKFEGRPEAELAVREAIGRLYHELGRPNEALFHLERAVSLMRTINRDSRADSKIEGTRRIALLRDFSGALVNNDRAGQAADILKGLLEENVADPEMRFAVRLDLLSTDRYLGTTSGDTIGEMVSLRDKLRTELGPGHKLEADLLGRLANAYCRLEQIEKSTRAHREQVEVLTALDGPDSYRTLSALNNLGAHLSHSGQTEEARKLHEKLHEDMLRVLGDQHILTVVHTQNMGAMYLRLKEYELAEKYLVETMHGYDRLDRSRTPSALWSLAKLGRYYDETKQYEKGVQLFHERVDPVASELRPTPALYCVLTVYAKLQLANGMPGPAGSNIQLAEMYASQSIEPISDELRSELREVQLAIDKATKVGP